MAAKLFPAPAAVKSGNGESLDKNQLLKLTPSQRVTARRVARYRRVARVQPATAAAPSGPSVDERLAQIDPRDEIVPMSPLRKRSASGSCKRSKSRRR